MCLADRFPICSLSFHSLNKVRYSAEVSGFDEDHVINFSSSGLGEGCVCVCKI